MSTPVSPPHPHPHPPTIFRQQQIFIWPLTPGLCSPGCRQPRSSSAASRWFPGCTRPRFPPAGAAEVTRQRRTQERVRATEALPVQQARSCPGHRGQSRVRLPTLSTKVLSLSGISSGMVVLTSTMADRGMLTLGFDD